MKVKEWTVVDCNGKDWECYSGVQAVAQRVACRMSRQYPELRPFKAVRLTSTQTTTDPAADYLVLVRVRETWDDWLAVLKFWEALWKMWEDRRMASTERRGLPSPALYYEPGDYARAALAALRAAVKKEVGGGE